MEIRKFDVDLEKFVDPDGNAQSTLDNILVKASEFYGLDFVCKKSRKFSFFYIFVADYTCGALRLHNLYIETKRWDYIKIIIEHLASFELNMQKEFKDWDETIMQGETN